MRTKEEANDYRYFPDPDLLPVVLTDEFIDEIRRSLPELPDEKALRFARDYGLSVYDALVLTSSRELAAYFEDVAQAIPGEPKLAANWVMGELAASLNKDGLDIGRSPISSAKLAALLRRIADQTISGKIAKEVFEAMWVSGKEPDAIIEEQGLKQITDTAAIERVIDEVMAKNSAQLADYHSGKDKLFGFFVGQVMKATGGKANPAELNKLLKAKLAG
jgi:aspartyl-tRNA(Asn)/glutamyl-tRNA(Gln) amidotransferase subunit B